MAAITLSALRKNYGSAQVIKGVDISIENGEFVVFELGVEVGVDFDPSHAHLFAD